MPSYHKSRPDASRVANQANRPGGADLVSFLLFLSARAASDTSQDHTGGHHCSGRRLIYHF